MIDILYLAHGRPEFTKASHEALRLNTDWALADVVIMSDEECRGPVAVMAECIRFSKAQMIVKIDNDLIVPPGWLERCLEVMEQRPEIDLLGIEPTYETHRRGPNGWPAHALRSGGTGIERAYHVGGIGVFRRRAFEGRELPKPARDGRFGWTEWQIRHPEVRKAFLNPPLNCFLLDHLPLEPWRSLSRRYEAEGIQRATWGEYGPECSHLWEWWQRSVLPDHPQHRI